MALSSRSVLDTPLSQNRQLKCAYERRFKRVQEMTRPASNTGALLSGDLTQRDADRYRVGHVPGF